jgi:two-component system, chemotaxis family, CheB/CheR fusion protein
LGDHAAGVILSGTGSDGTRGVRALKEAGGLVVVQEPSNAKFDGMPRAAISAGVVDFILPVQQIPEAIVKYVSHAEVVRAAPREAVHSERDAFDQLLGLLRRQTGVDFAQYKSTTITRRVQRRMAISQAESLEAYLRVAQSSSAEVGALFKELLISVTRFFRDAESFEVIRREVIPSIVDKTKPGEGIRVWVAGCATGEEAYSLAMLFEEYFEAGGRPRDVKIFATDIDRDALEFAGAGIYPDSIAADVSPERLSHFFVQRGDSYQVARFLRQRVVFANHDVTRDPPFSRVSLITCRNLLIYFTPALQAQILSGFRFALRPGGFLFLGSSETPGEIGDELQVMNATAKIFLRTDVRGRLPEPRQGGVGRGTALSPHMGGGSGSALESNPAVHHAMDLLMRVYAPPCVLMTEHHEVIHLFGEPSPLIRLSSGAASLSLLQLLPRQVASMVGLATHRALREEDVAQYHAVPTDCGLLNLTVRPLPKSGGTRLLLVILELLGPARANTGESTVAADAQQQIVDLQQELQYSRENLQATIEELETSNEELQATNEELVASNEELQSTNEELQSVNEELHTLNAEYQQKIDELMRLSNDINNLLLSTRLGIVFLDAELNITRFTPAITQVMNLMERDIGRPISHLAPRFDTDEFFGALRQVQATRQPTEREFKSPEGRVLLLRVAPYVAENGPMGGLVVTIVDVTVLKQAEIRLAQVLDALPQQVALIDHSGTITLVNRAWREFALQNGAHDDARTGVGANYLEVCDAGKPNDEQLTLVRSQLRELLQGTRSELQIEYPCHSPSEERWFLMQAKAVQSELGGFVVSHTNITARKRLELALAQSLFEPQPDADAKSGGPHA